MKSRNLLTASLLRAAAMAALLAVVASCDGGSNSTPTPVPQADVTQPSTDVEQPLSCGPGLQKADDGRKCVPLVEPDDCSDLTWVSDSQWTCEHTMSGDACEIWIAEENGKCRLQDAQGLNLLPEEYTIDVDGSIIIHDPLLGDQRCTPALAS